MNENKHKIDMAKLTPEQREKLDSYNQAASQIKSLKDIADLAEGILSLLDDNKEEKSKTSKDIGALLMDMRDSLTALKDKEAPKAPDQTKPVVDAVGKLEQAISKAIKSIDVKPVVNVDAPQVHLNPTEVDLKGIEKILKIDIPKAFKQAINSIPVPPKPDNKELLQAQKEMIDHLEDISRFTSKKPSAPTQVKVINPDGSLVGSNPVAEATLWGYESCQTLATLFTLDLLGYNSITVQITSAGSATVTYEASDDNTTWVAVPMDTLSSNTTAPATTSTTVGIRGRSSVNRYFRARVSAYTSGVVTAYYTATSETFTGGAVNANLAGQTLPTLTNITNWGNLVDNAAFTDGTTRIMPSGYIFDEVAGTALSENDGAAARIDSKRAQVLTLEDATTRGQRLAITTTGAAKVEPALYPTATSLNTYSVRITTNTTTTPVASTAYLSSITIASEVAGTTSTITIQDKSGTPLKLINALTTVAITTTPVSINFQTPIKMTSGIDIITAGVAAATVDIWINYYS